MNRFIYILWATSLEERSGHYLLYVKRSCKVNIWSLCHLFDFILVIIISLHFFTCHLFYFSYNITKFTSILLPRWKHFPYIRNFAKVEYIMCYFFLYIYIYICFTFHIVLLLWISLFFIRIEKRPVCMCVCVSVCMFFYVFSHLMCRVFVSSP